MFIFFIVGKARKISKEIF